MESKRKRDGWNRWSCLGAGLALEVCGGLGYTFAVYSQHLKQTLQYDQEDLDDIGAAKDLGYSLGILGGVLYNFIPPWLSVGLGSLLHILGYFNVYLTSAGKLHPPLWLLCAFFAVGVGGDSWIDGAAVMTSVQNFPDYRGTAIGLLKAQIGLSGAFFVTLYRAFLKPDVDAYVFLVATAPAIASIILAVFIRPFPFDDERNIKVSDRRFQVGYGATVVLGLCLLVSIFIQAWTDVDRVWLVFFAVTMLIQFILLIAVMTLYYNLKFFCVSLFGAHLDCTDSEEMVIQSQLKSKTSDLNSVNFSLEENNELLEVYPHDTQEYLEDHPTASFRPQPMQNQGYTILDQQTNGEGLIGMEGTVEKQDDSKREVELSGCTLLQNLQSINFWLLCLVAISGPGSGLAIINNFGQIGRSAKAHNIELFVGLISVASCFGRLIGGYGSDQAMKLMKYPRPVCLSVAHFTMAVGCLALSVGYIPLLYVGAVLVGSSYGSFWALTPPIISEVFGLQNFAALYKMVGAFGPVGAYVLSAKVLGHFYDEEADLFSPNLTGDDDDNICLGRQCFGFSLLVLGVVCLLGTSLGAILTLKNRTLYQRINNF